MAERICLLPIKPLGHIVSEDVEEMEGRWGKVDNLRDVEEVYPR